MTFSLFLSNMFFLSKLWNLSSRTVLTGAGPSPNPPPVPMLSLYTPRALFDRQSWRPKGQTLGDDGKWGIPRGFVQKWGTGPEFMAIKKQGKWWWTMEWWNFLKFSGTKPSHWFWYGNYEESKDMGTNSQCFSETYRSTSKWRGLWHNRNAYTGI